MDFNKIRVSHSSITDFNNCTRLYYFKNIYRNSQTGNRVQLVNPYLSLGSAVHDTIDEIVNFSPSKRLKILLTKRYEKVWEKYSGKRGGFASKKQEIEFKKRGFLMIKKFEKSTVIKRKTLKKNENLPQVALLKDIELVGCFDWIEILNNGNLHIIDFKTGKKEEKKNSWQLPIYYLLALENYGKKIEKLSYWYLQKNNEPTMKKMHDPKNFLLSLQGKALKIKELIENKNFSCNSGYKKCYWCRNYETIVSGKAEYVGFDEKMKKDLYYLTSQESVLEKIQEKKFLSDIEKKILIMRIEGKSINDVQEKMKLTKKNIGEISMKIKKEIKENLTKNELIIFIEHLKKNGKRFNL